MKITTTAKLLTIASGLCYFGAVSAGIKTFDNFIHAGSDIVDYTVTIDDSPAGEFKITYKVTNTSPNTVGKLTGFFFDIGPINAATLPDPDTTDPYTAANLGLAGEMNASGTSICGQAFGDVNAVSGSGGCNSTLNLGTTMIDGIDFGGFLFDVGLAWKTNDLSMGQEGMFSISDLGGAITLADWSAVGLRGQAVGDGTGSDDGSAKEFMLMGNGGVIITSVPEPATASLMGVALASAVYSGLFRRKKMVRS
jgi:hypothetical protein